MELRDYHSKVASMWMAIDNMQRDLNEMLISINDAGELPAPIAMKLFRIDTKLRETYATLQATLDVFHEYESKDESS